MGRASARTDRQQEPVTTQADVDLPFRRLAENASDVVYLSGPDQRIRWIAPTVEQCLGWTPAELIGTTFNDLLHPDDAASVKDARERLYQGNDLLDPRGVELRLRCKDGSYRWLSGRAAAIVGEDGAAQGVVVGLRDVDDLVQQRERAKEQEHRAHQIMETMVDPHVVLEPLRDPDGAIVDFRYIDANQAACFLTGWTREEFLGRTLLTELPGHRGSTLFDHYCRVIDTGEPLALDGFRFPASIVASERYFDVRVVKSGDALNYTLRDVTDRFRAQLRLQESEHRYRRLAENAADVVYEWELDGTLTWVSPSVTHALGWTPEQVIGHNVREYIHPDDEERSRDPAMFGHAHFEARVLGAAGDWRWMRIARRVVRDTEGRATGYIETAHDIQAEMTARMRLAHQIGHDPLTGLPNRASLLNDLERLMRDRTRPMSLLAVGVDDLGAVTDAFTHVATDRVLVHAAQRLTAVVHPMSVARTTEDEFVVLAPAEDTEELADLAERIQQAVASPISIGGHDIDVTVSIGIATRSDAENAEEWLRNAASALHHAETNGGNRWEFQDALMARTARERIILRGGIREGLSAGQFHAWFQPIVSLSDATARGFEALARWVLPDGSVVGPDVFIPAAAHADLIVELDRTILVQTVHAMAATPSPVPVSVNLSAASMTDPSLVATVRQVLESTGVPASRLHLEVTETSLMRPSSEMHASMLELTSLGVTWWVDDFGTGYSSITHLRDLPIQGLKLDRSFVDGMTTDPTRSRLALGLAGLARGLGLRTVAEGVETPEQAALLVAQGWEMGQGWLYGRPQPHMTT